MNRSTLTRKNPNKKSRRIARGGVRGNHTAGRGVKGQKSRAGHKLRPEWRDTIKRLPKLRGRGKNSNKSIQSPYVALNIGTLDAAFTGNEVTPETLVEAGLVSKQAGKFPKIKILAHGELSKKLSVKGVVVSETAKEKIVKAGGSVA